MKTLGLLSVAGMMLAATSVGALAQESSSKTPMGQSQGQVQQVPTTPGYVAPGAPAMSAPASPDMATPYSGSSTAPYTGPTTGTGSNGYVTGHMK